MEICADLRNKGHSNNKSLQDDIKLEIKEVNLNKLLLRCEAVTTLNQTSDFYVV